jgi:2-polyprenyl-6-methoxyphenol hydroxylase-like FAD-dependent oxidoreductase
VLLSPLGWRAKDWPFTVLEATLEYPDRVRGEAIMPWGAREAQALGVDRGLLDAGASVSPVWDEYTEDADQPVQISMSEVIEDVPGAVNMPHPDACQAIITAAANAGATVVRGARRVNLTGGGMVTVSYDVDCHNEVTAPLVVGADGRGSVVRRQCHIPLHRQDEICYASGLLVAGPDEVPGEQDIVGTDGDFLFALFDQGRGRARVYLFTGRWGQHQFSGHNAVPDFLAACKALRCGDLLTNSTPAGSCAT